MSSESPYNNSQKDMVRQYRLDEALLSRPLSELSLDELRIARDLLRERIRAKTEFNACLGKLGTVHPTFRLPEKTIQALYDGSAKLDRDSLDYEDDLKIIEGLIKKKESKV